MQAGTQLQHLLIQQEIRQVENQKGAQGPGAQKDLGKLPPDYIQVLVKNSDGTYSVAS